MHGTAFRCLYLITLCLYYYIFELHTVCYYSTIHLQIDLLHTIDVTLRKPKTLGVHLIFMITVWRTKIGILFILSVLSFSRWYLGKDVVTNEDNDVFIIKINDLGYGFVTVNWHLR